jgi:hypothetical protein
MTRRALASALCTALLATTAVAATPLHAKWPAWLTIESPVNAFDQASRGALLLVTASVREGQTQASDLDGSAEGLVNGARKSVKLHFEPTAHPNVYAMRPHQWPAEGTWLLRIALFSTTAIVTLKPDGTVASVKVPTYAQGSWQIPSPVTDRDIDAALAAAATTTTAKR